MSDRIQTELERFASALIEAQQALLNLLRSKRAALSASDLSALAALREPEIEAAKRLQSLVAWRAKVLEAARNQGRDVDTLTDLAQSFGAPGAVAVARFEESRRLAAAIQQESWVQWVITNRCCNFYTELLELIAQGGSKPPTYNEASWSRHGGAVLDASA